MPKILNETEHRYLSLEGELSLRDHFELRMLEENRISGLLPLFVCDDEGVLKLNYDITGLDPLSEVVALRKLRSADLRQLILNLKHVVSGLDPYLLDTGGIVLNAESVYLSPQSGAPCFLYLPGRKSDFSGELTEFLQVLLGASDHDDYPSVVLAYRLYKESIAHPSALDRLEQILISQERLDGNIPVSAAARESIPVDEMLAEAEAVPEVSLVELREAPVRDYAAAAETSSPLKPGLLRKLFRKNGTPESGVPEGLSQSEEAQWTEVLEPR